LKQELKSKEKQVLWFEDVRAQALVRRTCAGELEGLRELMIMLGANKTKYRLENGTIVDTTEWIRPHLWEFYKNNSTQDGLLAIQQSSALVGDEDLLLEVQGQIVAGTGEGVGAHTVVVEKEDPILAMALEHWDPDSAKARDHAVLVKGGGEPSVLTAKWLNMESEERADFMLERHGGEPSTQKGEDS